MFWIALLIGLGSGGIICFAWQQRQRQQVRRMLYSYGQEPDEPVPFAPLSSVRRELKALYEEKQALELELNQFYKILERSPVGYLRIDGDNQLLWCNRQAQELLHLNRWQPDEVRLLLELVRSYELDQLIEGARSKQKTQTSKWELHPSHDEKTLAVSQGNSVHLKGSAVPMYNGEVSVFLEDQEALHILKLTQEKLLSDLAHELRTPLTAMRLLTETLSTRLEGQEQKWVERLLGEVNRLYYLVQDWLEISRLESHPHQVLSSQTFDIVELLHQTWEILAPIATQKNIELRYEGLDELKMQGDCDRLTQVFLNLFDNAIKYNPQAAPVMVELAHEETQEEITIDIIDQGNGFAPDDLPYVFERLYRGDQARIRHGESMRLNQGSGLGLAIVQQIIEAHGGQITAQNHPELGGAWLQITLPTTFSIDDLET